MDDISTGRLPDFIFARRPDIELECDQVLAGLLVTNIPIEQGLSEPDNLVIQQIINQLTHAAKSSPDFTEAYIWRTGCKPAGALSPPFDDGLLEERSRRCICIMVTSGTGSMIKVPSDLLRQITGREHGKPH